MYADVENFVYRCLLCLTSSHWQSAFDWLSVNSSKNFRIFQCSSPIILKVVCCVGRISAAADFEMPVCWARCGERCRVAQRCRNFPAIWEAHQCSAHGSRRVMWSKFIIKDPPYKIQLPWWPGFRELCTHGLAPVLFVLVRAQHCFLVSCLPVTIITKCMLQIMTVQNDGQMFWHLLAKHIFSHHNIVVLWHYVKLYSQFSAALIGY
jgi:hypothetical protein